MIGKRTGQAAMEYLMTYGWALLVIVVVIAILLVMNPFSAPQSCKFDSVGFVCDAPAIGTDGYLFMKLTNGNNNAINLFGVKCTQAKTNAAPDFTAPTDPLKMVQRQDYYQINSTNKVQCTDANGNKLTSIASGTDFSGKIWVYYRNTEDGSDYPMRTASATIVTKVVGTSSTVTPPNNDV
ncbi:MAG: hypothetical protein WCY41_01645 [Candidatus Micrarchaeia archaeon]